jgi:hypothetical protein
MAPPRRIGVRAVTAADRRRVLELAAAGAAPEDIAGFLALPWLDVAAACATTQPEVTIPAGCCDWCALRLDGERGPRHAICAVAADSRRVLPLALIEAVEVSDARRGAELYRARTRSAEAA